MNEVYKKWESIIDTLLEYDKNTSLKIRKFLAEYAEHHSQKEINFLMDGYSTLPISLKLLTMLDLEDIELNIIDAKIPKMKIVENGVGLTLETEDNSEYESFGISVSVTKDQIMDLGDDGIDLVQKIEHLLLEENAKAINEQLKTSKELNVYIMVNNINMEEIINHGNGIKEHLKNPKISISNLIKIN